MLCSLAIRDVVLIDRLELDFSDGLSVLTGETGAGKSILLDSLGLALGARAESGLVRHGQDKAQVSAHFQLPADHAAFTLLAAHDIDTDPGDALVLRRVLTRDGRSRAHVNDQPVSIGLLRRLGGLLVEIQGQFDQQGLLDPTTHRATLDAQGGLEAARDDTRALFARWGVARTALDDAQRRLDTARAEEEWLRHAVGELESLAPQPGEEEKLAEERRFLMHGEKLRAALQGAETELGRGKGAAAALRAAQRHLEREAPRAEGRFDAPLDALDRAAIELEEAERALAQARADLDLDPQHQEAVEERLFALRAMARKHETGVEDLPALAARLRADLDALEYGEKEIVALAAAEAAAKAAYRDAAEALSTARQAAAQALDHAINAELAPLRMEKARFATRLTRLAPEDWSAEGLDRVAFEVATNPGSPPGPLGKIASGGELSRFLLALKVVLARVSAVPTLVFDEVDSGVGGATAAAIGERLHRLAGERQILCITHSPQVAARGRTHYTIRKQEAGSTMVTRVTELMDGARREEIARMLAGHHITDEARAAADSLLAVRP